VNAEVDQRTAAGVGLVAEPVAGEAGAAEIRYLRAVDVSEVSLVYKVERGCRIVSVTADEADHEKLAVAAGAFFQSLGGVHRHGLFAEHVYSRVERKHRAGLVLTVPCTYADRVKLAFLEHLLFVGVAFLEAVSFDKSVGALLFNVAAGDELDPIAELLVAGCVKICDCAAADDSDSYSHFK